MNGGTSISNFDHVLVERSSSIQLPQFTFASRNLMIHSLSHNYIPSCQEILTTNPLFKGYSQYHGRKQDPYASDNICKRWTNLQKRYVCAPFENGTDLLHKKDNPSRQVPWIEECSIIVWKIHVSNGQHLSLTRTIEAIRESWSTSTMNGGLDINFVKQCIESCNSCSSHRTKRKMQMWHEKHVCHIDEVESKLDDINKIHIVVRAT